MRYGSIMALISVGIMIQGCAPKGPLFDHFAVSDQHHGTVYVYRPSSIVGARVEYRIYHSDGRVSYDHGLLHNGGYIAIELPVGSATIWAQTEVNRSITLTVDPQSIVCIRGKSATGIRVARPALEVVDRATCDQEILHTHRGR